mmetsp:Transcript_30156/g.87577  ORF Transcript_30156/g.87577 Transcript_30156/m.87577 type:complete len:738 (+) Transcript_30156:231-2444(+)
MADKPSAWLHRSSRVVLIVTVDIGKDKQDKIHVRKGDDPRTTAENFIKLHRLNRDLTDPLTTHIEQNLEALRLSQQRKRERLAQRLTQRHESTTQTQTHTQTAAVQGSLPPTMHLHAEQSVQSVQQQQPADARADADADASPDAAHILASELVSPTRPSARKGASREEVEPTPTDKSAIHRGQRAKTSERPQQSDKRPHRPPDAVAKAASPSPFRPTQKRASSRAQSNPPPVRGHPYVAREGERGRRAREGGGARLASTSRGASEARLASGHGSSPKLDREGTCRSAVFDKLYQRAEAKRVQLENLKGSVEHEYQHKLDSTRFKPHTAREGADVVGRRLYEWGRIMQDIKEKKRLERLVELERQELEEVTLKPNITRTAQNMQREGQPLWHRLDCESIDKRRRLSRIREEMAKKELEGCTFKPDISRRSRRLVAARMSELQLSGPLYEFLYSDALRRHERDRMYKTFVPPEATFRPQTLAADNGSRSPPADDGRSPRETLEAMMNRLCGSSRVGGRRGEEAPELADGGKDPHTGQELFKPKTGRPPLHGRNSEKLPIWEFLHRLGEQSKQAKLQHATEEEQKVKALAEMRGTSHTSSAKLFQEAKARRLRELFRAVDADRDGVLTGGTADADSSRWGSVLAKEGVDPQLQKILWPVLEYLKDTGSSVPFEQFEQAVDYQVKELAAQKIPIHALFVRRATVSQPTTTSTSTRAAAAGKKGGRHTLPSGPKDGAVKTFP